ncbi:4-alpha-glucanotransferase [Pendulispora albinea]|uniref:4-alpha-glucanotransferase n=1 Tax=Pendulispora albinea TaxID=2741071 RepID=A0ABZ2LY71_9BACT
MNSRELLHEARRALGIEQLVLAIHDSSFPGFAGEDLGRGSPYSRGARDLFAFARSLGFTGVQLGPQGETTLGNRSPYDGTVFAKSVLSIDLLGLTRDPDCAELVDGAIVRDRIAGRPTSVGGDGVQYSYAFRAMREVVKGAWQRFSRSASAPLRARYDAFRTTNAVWLDHDEAYERATGHFELGDAFAFGQFLVHAQHESMRAGTAQGGLTMYGDLQVGLSLCDRWRREPLMLAGYAMGAPPSRTDPDGQPWGYPVLDPGAREAMVMLELRVAKMLRELDGLRIDHPHGLVCPWVYDALAPDPIHAVKHGARLFASPDLPDHPALARHAIVRPAQLDRSLPRHADGWVRELDETQVDAYGTRFDSIVQMMLAAGRDLRGVVCEVLSTQPYPLCRVMDRHGLGRFRVTQKANPLDPLDVYRHENARPTDWMMVGNHDTAPLLLVVERWRDEGVAETRARYLEERLALPRGSLGTDVASLTQAMFAALFASAARNVMVFVPDLLGVRAIYNRPGIVDDVNWTWRVPENFRGVYTDNVARGEAMNVPRAMAMALRAKSDATRARTDLIEALERT